VRELGKVWMLRKLMWMKGRKGVRKGKMGWQPQWMRMMWVERMKDICMRGRGGEFGLDSSDSEGGGVVRRRG
jgi:hypothetical protein